MRKVLLLLLYFFIYYILYRVLLAFRPMAAGIDSSCPHYPELDKLKLMGDYTILYYNLVKWYSFTLLGVCGI